MVYLYDEYFKANPREQKQVLNKFIDSEKNLHEMSLDELNKEVSQWKRLKSDSANEQKRNIMRYLKWLQEEQGINTDPDIIKQIHIPILSEDYYVYSTAEIHLLWKELFNELEKQATLNGTSFHRTTYLVSYAVGILSFYGFTAEQLFALTLSDVQQDGIKGYDIDFTEEDMDILMEYKNLTALSNRKKLVGYKYIRSVTENVDEKLITHPIMRLKGSDYIKYLTRELNYKVLYEYGVFNRIFNYENEHNCIVQGNSKSPDWFLSFVEELLRNTGKSSAQKKNNIVNDGTTNKYRKRYINYRITRKTWIKLLSDIGMDSNDVIVQKLHKEYLIKK